MRERRRRRSGRAADAAAATATAPTPALSLHSSKARAPSLLSPPPPSHIAPPPINQIAHARAREGRTHKVATSKREREAHTEPPPPLARDHADPRLQGCVLSMRAAVSTAPPRAPGWRASPCRAHPERRKPGGAREERGREQPERREESRRAPERQIARPQPGTLRPTAARRRGLINPARRASIGERRARKGGTLALLPLSPSPPSSALLVAADAAAPPTPNTKTTTVAGAQRVAGRRVVKVSAVVAAPTRTPASTGAVSCLSFRGPASLAPRARPAAFDPLSLTQQLSPCR
jgi:hypothetical protein